MRRYSYCVSKYVIYFQQIIYSVPLKNNLLFIENYYQNLFQDGGLLCTIAIRNNRASRVRRYHAPLKTILLHALDTVILGLLTANTPKFECCGPQPPI